MLWETISFNEPSILTVSATYSALDRPEKHGISSRFLNFFNNLDQSVGHRVVGENQTVSGKVAAQAQQVAAKTKEVDQQRGVSATFQGYYSKALGTTLGQK